MFKFLTSKVAESSVSEIVSEVSEVASEVSTTASNGIQLEFTTANMETAALWLITGMLGVFAVIGVIILSVTILNKAGNKKEQ